jgi:hypothetical protein
MLSYSFLLEFIYVYLALLANFISLAIILVLPFVVLAQFTLPNNTGKAIQSYSVLLALEDLRIVLISPLTFKTCYKF